jgi:hypothetical protein
MADHLVYAGFEVLDKSLEREVTNEILPLSRIG